MEFVLQNETTKLLERPCTTEQAREVCEVFGDIEAPTIYQWVLAGLAKKAHDGNASAAKELRSMIADATRKEFPGVTDPNEWMGYIDATPVSW